MALSPISISGALAQDVTQNESNGAEDREYLVGVLTTIAEPVLEALAEEELHERLPVHP